MLLGVWKAMVTDHRGQRRSFRTGEVDFACWYVRFPGAGVWRLARSDPISVRVDGALVGVHVIGALASELAGTGQALIRGEATVEDVVRMGYNTPTYTYGYKLAGIDALRRLEPEMLRAMRLPSNADRV